MTRHELRRFQQESERLSSDQNLRRVQRQYERLRADQPHLPQQELWRQAEEAAGVRDPAVEPELSSLAVVGFILMCGATGLATILFIWNWNSPFDWAYSGIGGLLWLSTFLLGIVALGVVASANDRIRRSYGALSGERLVTAGFVLAAVGTSEVFIISFPLALVGSL